MKTKVSLMTTEGLSAMDLNVDTVKGVVTLHGSSSRMLFEACDVSPPKSK